MRLHTYQTGVAVLQLTSHSLEATLPHTKALLASAAEVGITAEEVSQETGISLVLAR